MHIQSVYKLLAEMLITNSPEMSPWPGSVNKCGPTYVLTKRLTLGNYISKSITTGAWTGGVVTLVPPSVIPPIIALMSDLRRLKWTQQRIRYNFWTDIPDLAVSPPKPQTNIIGTDTGLGITCPLKKHTARCLTWLLRLG